MDQPDNYQDTNTIEHTWYAQKEVLRCSVAEIAVREEGKTFPKC